MSAPNLKTWKFDNGVYVSPRFPETVYVNYKRFLIRGKVVVECDERNHVIKIPTTEAAKGNIEQLKHLKLI
jgi:hypothetical protein